MYTGIHTGIQNGSGVVCATSPNHSNLWEPREEHLSQISISHIKTTVCCRVDGSGGYLVVIMVHLLQDAHKENNISHHDYDNMNQKQKKKKKNINGGKKK